MFRCAISIVITWIFWGCSVKSSDTTTQPPTANVPLCTSKAIATLTGIDQLPDPTYRTGIGNSHLSITTKSKEAQRWFDQGLNHLHGFWHLEAYRAFRQVLKYDSTCAMGYWGVAMCQPGFGDNSSRWLEAINRATTLKAGTSAIEQTLITASETLIREGLGSNAVQKFRELYQKYPDQPEAISFAGIMLRQHESEATQQEVKTLLEKALKKYPTNTAIMHYYIHVMELRPEFAQAKAIATRMIQLAPNAPHLLHMPGHLYYLAGQYQKAIDTYKTALHIETTYHTTEKIPFRANQNYIHNLQFLAVAQAEISYEAALKTANQLANLSLQTQIPNNGATLMFDYEARILPALVHIRFRKFDKAIEHFQKVLNNLDNPISNPLVRTYFNVMLCYAQAMQSLEKNNINDAVQKGAELTQLMKNFEQQGMKQQNTPEFKSLNETYDIMSMARYELAGWIDNLDPAKPFNEAAWREAIKLQNLIKYDEPPRLMYPTEESLARLHKQRGEKTAMQKAIKAALAKRPNSKVIQQI